MNLNLRKVFYPALFSIIVVSPIGNTTYAAENGTVIIVTQNNVDPLKTKVSIDVNDVSPSDFFEILKKNSNGQISFIFAPEDISSIGRITIKENDITVESLLQRILTPSSGLIYSVKNNIITIKKGTTQVAGKVSISGRVVDDNNQPITGATVIISGTSEGAITGSKGDFTIKASANSSVEVSFVGMKDLKQTITDTSKPLVLKMAADELQIDEVIVTGIFERRSGSFTGSATTLKAEDLKRVGATNVFASLKNLDPSLMMFDNLEAGSDPNKNPKMALRGTSSFDMGEEIGGIKGTYGNDPNAPLFILDGFETTVQRIMDLDMNRIESLTILKDASAKAIYGSKAANGVIVIETRKAGDGTLRVTYNGTVDIQAPDLSSYNLTNARQKLELETVSGLYTDTNNRLTTQIDLDKKYNRRLSSVVAGVDTDWLAKPLRVGIGTKHGISLDLGNKPLVVLADFSYNNISGVMKGSGRTTYSGSINLSYRHKNFTFRNILNVVSNIAKDSPYGTFSEYATINPYYTPYDQNGILLKNCALSVPGEDPKTKEIVNNPLYNAQLNTKLEQRYLDVTNNLYVEWLISKGLKATARMGITEKRNSADEFYPSNHLKFSNYTNEDYFRKGSYQQNVGWNKKLSGDFNAQYNTSIKNAHDIFMNAGFSVAEDSYEEIVYNAEGFPNDKMNDIIFAKQYLKDSKPSGSESTKRDIAFLFAANYSYKNRYLFDGSYRTSASSQFGKNNRWGQFWSVGAGWNIHNEPFMKNVKVINNLKIRGSIGYTGSQNSDAYEAMATYTYMLDRTYRGQLGSYLKGMRNDDLKWQHKLDYSVGFDLNIARKLIVVFDYYIGITQNNLLDMTIPPSLGFSTYKENLGTVDNRGFDVKLTYNIWQRPKDNSYLSVTTSFFANKNKIDDLSDAMKTYNERQDAIISDAINNNKPVQKFYDGVSMNAIWAVRSLGIDPANGREIYLRRNGTPTYSYSAADQIVLGDKLAKLSGVLGINFQYKGLGMNATFRYNIGAKHYNETLLNKVENTTITNNVDMRMYDGVWRTPGDVKPYKKLGDVWIPEEGGYKTMKTQPTSRFIQRRNEFSLSNISLSYEFRTWDFIKKAKMENLKFSFYMNEVFLLSSIEVERGTSYPFARGFNFALTATF